MPHLYKKGQQVIERTGSAEHWQDRETYITAIRPWGVTTATGLTYNEHGVSDGRPPAGYRTIRDLKPRSRDGLYGKATPKV